MKTPILETARLLLRPLTRADAAAAFAGWTSDDEVARFMRWTTHTSVQDTEAWLSEEEAETESGTHYVWGFVLKETGALIGSGGLLLNTEAGLFEPGYNLMRDKWGCGITSEAMQEILRFAWETLGVSALYALHAVRNPASGAVLRRLGFVPWRAGAYTRMDGTVLDATEYRMLRPGLLGVWGIDEVAVPTQRTTWAVGAAHMLKLYAQREEAERNLRLSRALLQNGVPAAQTVETVRGQALLDVREGVYALTKKLPGVHLKAEEVLERPALARACGRLIGQMHTALDKTENGGVKPNRLSDEMRGWVFEAHRKSGFRYIGEARLLALCCGLEAAEKDLPRGVIHRDLHLGNFLFENGAVTGYIDFDLAQENIRVFDLCYFALSVLSAETESEGAGFWEALFTGYAQAHALTQEERNAAPCVAACIEALFTAWYDTQGDTENAEKAAALFRKTDKAGL